MYVQQGIVKVEQSGGARGDGEVNTPGFAYHLLPGTQSDLIKSLICCEALRSRVEKL